MSDDASASPSPVKPPGSIGGDSSGRSRPPLESWETIVTAILLVVDLGLVGISVVVASWGGAAEYSCQNNPTTCDEALIAIAQIGLKTIPWLMLAGSVVLSIVLMKRRRSALFVPLVGGVAIIACVVLWNHLILVGLGAR